ncbi:hypothetical protein [Saccharibacillus alkalitolerans]|uniref:Transcription regulator PadR C-terminal domain-containing protein n=1 Tax=Saccharibacillus alkalitolerans TaxID=2705290 RepID=A0ABX0F7D8_9BACL|nr:hypothetical protein [Saccharibacillus alkalitolerans]NGZ76867.1 hypothetical protein [Saccharibacillus alkalitolerans]
MPQNVRLISEHIARIEKFRERQQEQLRMMQAFKGNLEQVLESDRDHMHFYLTVLFGEKMYRAYTEWADEAAELLRQAKPAGQPDRRGDSSSV